MKLIQLWQKTRGKKRHSGAAILILPIAIRLVARLAKFDVDNFEGAEEILSSLMAVGGALYGVGWLDKILPKILQYTTKIEKALEIFNAWGAKKMKNKNGATFKQVVSGITAAGVALGTGIGIGLGTSGGDGSLKYAETVAIETVFDRAAGIDTVWRKDTTVAGEDTTISRVFSHTIARPVQRPRAVYRSDSAVVVSQHDTIYALIYVVDAAGVSSGIIGVCRRVIDAPIDTNRVARIYNRLLVHTEGKPKKEEKEIAELGVIQ